MVSYTHQAQAHGVMTAHDYVRLPCCTQACQQVLPTSQESKEDILLP